MRSIFSFIADMMLPDGSQNQEWDWNIFVLEREFPAPKVEPKVGVSFASPKSRVDDHLFIRKQ